MDERGQRFATRRTDRSGIGRRDLWKQSGDRELYGAGAMADAAIVQPDSSERRRPGRGTALRFSDTDQRPDTAGARPGGDYA